MIRISLYVPFNLSVINVKKGISNYFSYFLNFNHVDGKFITNTHVSDS